MIALISVFALGVGLLVVLLLDSKSMIPPIPAAPPSQATGTASGKPSQDLSIYKTDPKWIWWNEQSARDPYFEWKMPIRFFGKVIDEKGSPVAGATASFLWTDMSSEGTSSLQATTDDSGRFSLENAKGKRLQVRVTKNDYYTSANNSYSFEYAAFFEENYHLPDPDNPVVFWLRKKGDVPQELTVRRTLMGIKPTGEAHYIDLTTTRKPGDGRGDIAISITRTAAADVKQYDWSASIEGVNGAELLESTDEFMFEAPEAGYKRSYSYQFASSDPSWKNQTRRKYFMRARNGKIYGRLEISFIPKYRDSGAIDIKFFVNPTSSRNLEYEPNTVLPR